MFTFLIEYCLIIITECSISRLQVSAKRHIAYVTWSFVTCGCALMIYTHHFCFICVYSGVHKLIITILGILPPYTTTMNLQSSNKMWLKWSEVKGFNKNNMLGIIIRIRVGIFTKCLHFHWLKNSWSVYWLARCGLDISWQIRR